MKKIFTQLSVLIGLSATIGVANAQTPSWVWAKSASNEPAGASFSNEKVNGVATDAAGNVYVTGEFNGFDLDFGGTPSTTITPDINSNTDAFVAKYNASGTLQWVKSYGGTYSDGGVDIAIDAAGNIVTTGYYSASSTVSASFGTNTFLGTQTNVTLHFYVMKLNPSTGNITWIQKSNDLDGGPSNQIITSIGTDAANNVYIGGTFYSTALSYGAVSVSSAGGNTSFFYVKFNSSGTPQQARAQAAGDTRANYITVDGAGNVYVTGEMHDNTTISGQPMFLRTGNQNICNVYLLKFSTNGVFQWFNNYGSPSLSNYATGTALKANGNGKIMLAVSYENINEGTPGFEPILEIAGTSYLSSGKKDVLLLTFSSTGALEHVGEIKGGDNEVVNDISFNTTTNDFYVVGNFKSPELNYGVGNAQQLFNIGTDDIFVMNYTDALGDGWAINNTSADAAQSIASNASSVYVGGAFSAGLVAFGNDLLTNTGYSPGSTDLFVAKIGVCNLTPADATISVSGDSTICSSSSITLTAPAGLTSYLWSDGVTTTRDFTTSSAGDYTVTVTDANGCSATSAPQGVYVNNSPTPVIIRPLPTNNYCDGDDIILTSNLPFATYYWTVDGVFVTDADSYTISSNGTCILTVTDNNGCQASSSPREIMFFSPPTPVIATNASSQFCETFSQQAYFHTTQTYTSYIWYPSNEMTDTLRVSAPGMYNLTVQVTDTLGCIGVSDTLNFEVYAQPNIQPISGVDTLTIGDSQTYTTNFPANGTVTWSVENGTITSGQGTATITVQWDTVGQGSVSVVWNDICQFTDTLGITINDVSIGINPASNAGFGLYPNPASNLLALSFGTMANRTISIQNTLGQTVAEFTANEKKTELSVSDLAPGVYTLIVNDGKTQSQQKFVKE